MNEKSHLYTIEELAGLTGVSVRTIRFYISEGIIPGPGARGKGAAYGDEHLLKLRLARRLAEQRVPLTDIRARLSELSADDARGLLDEDALRRSAAGGGIRPAITHSVPVRAARPGQGPSISTRFDERAACEALSQRTPAPVDEEMMGASLPQRAPVQAAPFLPIQPQAAPSSSAESWSRHELAPGVELHVRADARVQHADLITPHPAAGPSHAVTQPFPLPSQRAGGARHLQKGGTTMPTDTVTVTLEARPERRLIRPGRSYRHIDYRINVSAAAPGAKSERTPLSLSLVLDRSGSMNGDKIATAKSAALAVLDRLDARDQVALVIFDNEIELLHPASLATPEAKQRMANALQRVHARSNTALHEGWLTGCRAIAADHTPDGRLARCFLLTDGLANVGLTDPEQIAAQAADVRRNTGIGTSTFGVGVDYDEGLLGPMAVAGGGQFHHLRTPQDIASTFVGELGDMLAVAAGQVRIELQFEANTEIEVVSEYWSGLPAEHGAPDREAGEASILIGDLMPGEERHAVIRFGFPSAGQDGGQVQACIVWQAGGVEQRGEWQRVRFADATHKQADAEVRDPGVMHWVGLHHAQRAKRRATELNNRGQLDEARDLLRRVVARIAEYAGTDIELLHAIDELQALERTLTERPLFAAEAKEMYFRAQSASRMQRDYRK